MADLITVACKIPNGLTVDFAGRSVTLNGGHASLPGEAGGYGLTSGIDADWWDSWVQSVTTDFPPLKSGAIFATPRKDSAQAQGREKSAVRTGFEGLNPETPAPGIEPTDETRKELAKASR